MMELLIVRHAIACEGDAKRWPDDGARPLSPRALPSPLLLPGGSPKELLALLARTRGQRLAVVGHQPDLGRLIAVCLPGSAASAAFELRKMAVALIVFHGSPRTGHGELRWLVPPKLLRAVR